MFWFELAVGWMAFLSATAFFVCLHDKRAARRAGHRRVPEKTLFLLALAGGAGGLWAGMYAFRHKTRHWYFVWGMPAILVLQVAAILYLLFASPLSFTIL